MSDLLDAVRYRLMARRIVDLSSQYNSHNSVRLCSCGAELSFDSGVVEAVDWMRLHGKCTEHVLAMRKFICRARPEIEPKDPLK